MPNRTSTTRKSSGVLLDPYGIYGTRTANRLRAARRRRQSQNAIVVIVLLAALAAGAQYLKMRRVMALKPAVRFQLQVPVVVPPLIARDERGSASAVMTATTDGRLLRFDWPLDSKTEPLTILDTAFPLYRPLQQGERAFVPCEDGKLYAVNWRQGKVLWSYTFGSPLTTRPAFATLLLAAPTVAEPARKVRRDIVIAVDGDGVMAALDAGSGHLRWKSKLPCPPGDSFRVTDGKVPRVLVPLIGSAVSRGGLWCLDAASGRVIWRFPADGKSEAAQFAPPEWDAKNNKLFLGNESGALFCLDAERGIYDPKKRIGWKAFAVPHESKSDATVSWRTPPLLFFGNERGDGSTRLVAGGSDGSVRCLSTENGGQLWQFMAQAPIANLQKFRFRGRDFILVCPRSGTLFLLDAANGAVVKRLASSGIFAGVNAAEESVIAITTAGELELFSLTL
jgi:outer membrane protein assembly factor BamB